MKMSKYFIAIMAALCLAYLPVLAQHPGKPGKPGTEHNEKDSTSRRERIQAMKIGYLTEKLELTPDEAKVFWPVFNQFEAEMKALRKKYNVQLKNDDLNLNTLTDAEAEKLINDMITFQQAEADLVKKYAVEFKKVIPAKKVAMLFKAEADFKRELVHRLKQKKN